MKDFYSLFIKELKSIYTLEDTMDMWEVIAVNRYNEYLAIQHSKKNKS